MFITVTGYSDPPSPHTHLVTRVLELYLGLWCTVYIGSKSLKSKYFSVLWGGRLESPMRKWHMWVLPSNMADQVPSNSLTFLFSIFCCRSHPGHWIGANQNVHEASQHRGQTAPLHQVSPVQPGSTPATFSYNGTQRSTKQLWCKETRFC